MADDSQKLTKKQRKGLAFREKIGKKKSKPEPLDVPELDQVDDQDVGHGPQERPSEKVLGKRKRADSDKTAIKDKKTPKKIEANSEAIPGEELETDENTPPKSSKPAKKSQKSRYILFVGEK